MSGLTALSAATTAASSHFSKHLALGILLILVALGLVGLRLFEAQQAAAARRRPSVLGNLAAPPPSASSGRARWQLGGALVLLVLGILFATRAI